MYIKNQLYLAVRQNSFWIGIMATGSYVAASFLYECHRYLGYDSSQTLDATELFSFNTNSPFWDIFGMDCGNCGEKG